MAGSGTTLVAARLRGHEAIGFDKDPLAVLIAGVWVGNLDEDAVKRKANEVLKRASSLTKDLSADTSYPTKANKETRTFLDFWFDPSSKIQLTALASIISGIRDPAIRNVLWCAFSRLIITKTSGASLAMDISHSRPHRKYLIAPKMPFDNFITSIERITKSSPFIQNSTNLPTASVKNADARNMPLPDGSIDFIITSPPYLNAIDYLRGHKLSLVWMGYNISEIRGLRASNVGTEVSGSFSEGDLNTENIIQKICSGSPLGSRHTGMLRQYLRDLRQILQESHRVLKAKEKAVFVIGDCNIKSTFISNSLAIQTLAEEVGFKMYDIKKRPLPENRRYLPPPRSQRSGDAMNKRMKEEVILTLKKSK